MFKDIGDSLIHSGKDVGDSLIHSGKDVGDSLIHSGKLNMTNNRLCLPKILYVKCWIKSNRKSNPQQPKSKQWKKYTPCLTFSK